MNTLTIKEFNKALSSNGISEIMQLYVEEFKNILNNSNSGRPLRNLTEIAPLQFKQSYYQMGLLALKPVFDGVKGLSANDIALELGFLAGVLDNEVLIGVDKTGGTPHIALYTSNEEILTYFAKKGAFADIAKFEKDLEQLKTKKKVSAYKNKNGSTVAMGRIDFESLEGDLVHLKFTLPRSFRNDFGSTFKLYPYSSFVLLAEEFKKFAKSKKALTVHQVVEKITKDNRTVEQKTRKLTFLPKVVEESYGRAVTSLRNVEEIRGLIEIKIAKCDCNWDPTRMILKAYDLESSLYGKSHTNIRFQDIIGVENCPPSSINTSQYTVDYEDLKSLFKTRVNSWKLADYNSFTVVPTEDMATIPDRKDFLMNWLSGIDDSTLYKVMTSREDLFGDISKGLDTKYTLKPKAEKLMKLVKLSNNMDERVKEVRDYLSRGICKIEALSKKGSNRSYVATNNEDILSMKLGKNYLWKFESDRNKLNALMEEVDRGVDKESFEDLVYKADLSGIVPLHNIGSGSESEMKAILEEGLESLKSSNRSNDYLVNFKQPYAETKDDFWGAVDVRRIESFEFGDVEHSKK